MIAKYLGVLLPLAALCMTIMPANSQQTLPAVDGFSGKVTVNGGSSDGNAVGGAEGAITMSLGHRFGLQLDAGVGGYDEPFAGQSAYYGAGAHLFWRDPSTGMVGLEGSYSHLDAYQGVDVFSAGIEAERYWGPITLGGVVGVTDGSRAIETNGRGQFRYDLDATFVAGSKLTWYPDENLALSVSGRVSGGDATGGLGVEWAPLRDTQLQPSLFARAALREGGEAYALAGVSIYFGGKSKSLIRRHREDDPPIANVMTLGNLGFTLGAIMKFKQHKDNPTQQPNGTPPSLPLLALCKRYSKC
ncbi:hypothetical protein [Roseibium aggregatum]|uniref:hypothetical protein n=1 Tax=Roseibium aggregatum TaxID=187304 RepID=UPI001E5703AC|nr:hypothetical protein [Roseibium aggregatum]